MSQTTTRTCWRCGRPILGVDARDHLFGFGACQDFRDQRIRERGAAVYYVHTGYGCGSGCCGHVIYIVDADDNELYESAFAFMHDREALEQDARALAHKYGVPVVPDRCEYLDD